MKKTNQNQIFSAMLLLCLSACSVPVAPLQPANPNLVQYCISEGPGKCFVSATQAYGWPAVVAVFLIFNALSFSFFAFLTGLGKALADKGESLGNEVLNRLFGRKSSLSLREAVKSAFVFVKKALTRQQVVTNWQIFIVLIATVFGSLLLALSLGSFLPAADFLTKTPPITDTPIASFTQTIVSSPTSTRTPSEFPTNTPTLSSTPQPSPTEVPSQTPMGTLTPTPSNTLQPANTEIPSPTATSIVVINPNSGFLDSRSVGEPPRGLVFSPDGKTIIVAGSNNSIQILTTNDLGAPIRKFSWTVGALRNIVEIPESDLFVAGSSDKKIHIWHSGLENPPGFFANHDSQVYSLAFAKTELGLILVSGGNNEIKFWSFPDGQLLRIIDRHGGIVNSLAFSPDGKWLASSGDDRLTLIWRVADDRQPQILGQEAWASSQINEVAFVPNETAMIVGAGDDGRVYVWGENEGEFSRLAGLPSFNDASLTKLVFSLDGELLVTGDVQGHLRIWDFKQRKSIALISAHEGPIISLAFSPDGRFLVTGGLDDYRVRLWQIRE